MADLKAGDVVVLKSGNCPSMTIARAKDGEVLCCWFVGERYGEYREHVFSRQSLKIKIEDDKAMLR